MLDSLKDITKKFISLNNFDDLNSVQKVTLDNFNSRKDLFIVSKTGTGKTHAYLIPVCENINTLSNKTQVIISLPTRELAYQVNKYAQVMKEAIPDLRILFVSGGDNKEIKKSSLNPHIIIGTPGKLKDLLQKGIFNISFVQLFIIDEADMTLEYGFIEDLDYIFSSMKKHFKVMCFSATLKDDAKQFISKYLLNPNIIYVKDKKKDPHIDHYLINAKYRSYNDVLNSLLKIINPFVCLIFCNSREECDNTFGFLIQKGYKAILLHGGLEPRDRKKALKDINANKYTYVVCSDVASRGLDIDSCSHVISLGFPKKREFYTHRTGRTGRNGRSGEAYTIYNNDEINSINLLKNEGYNFIFKEVKGNKLVDSKLRKFKSKYSKDVKDEINKIKNKKDKKIKPNYKKKKKLAIEKIKRKARRDFIKNEIKKQRKERYRKMAKDN